MTLNSVKYKITTLEDSISNLRDNGTSKPNHNACRESTPVITLTLLHPLKEIPVQHWKFEPESVIRIGRSTDNDVVLYSAVVSRRHIEIRRTNSSWELVSLGANGTYFNGNKINRMPVIDGMVFRLASSGPQIQIKIDSNNVNGNKQSNTKGSQGAKSKNISKDTVIK